MRYIYTKGLLEKNKKVYITSRHGHSDGEEGDDGGGLSEGCRRSSALIS